MKIHFTKLRIKDFLCLTAIIIVGFGWLLVDQLLLNEVYQRFIALFALLLLLFWLQFQINKPKEILRYANTLVLVCLSFIVATSIVLHIFIKNDFNYKSILIWIVTAILPYISGGIYNFSHKKG